MYSASALEDILTPGGQGEIFFIKNRLWQRKIIYETLKTIHVSINYKDSLMLDWKQINMEALVTHDIM